MLAGAPHIHGVGSVPQMMQQVLLALVPGVLVWVLLFGGGAIVMLLAAVAAALLAEVSCLYLRGRPLKTVTDGSAVVTAVLLVLCLSPAAPFWVAMVAAAFAIAIGKHAFGGLGRNLFNPAMLGFAFALISFPQYLLQWPTGAGVVDAVSSATPLIMLTDGLKQMRMVDELFGAMRSTNVLNMYLWLALAWFVGGIYLIVRRVIDWKPSACMLLAMFVVAGIFWGYDQQRYLAPWWHCCLGGTMLAAFFVVTDPVSSPTVLRAQLVFVCGVAVLTWWIRHFGVLADGIAFSVLIMNAFAPLLDKLLRPRVTGTAER